jgi:asparagine synthase (glutamine-hydrolysing)
LALWRRARHGDARTQTPFPYPDWLNPDLEARLELRRCWRDMWTWQPSPLNARHPRVHSGLVWPEWGTDDQYLRPSFTLPEIRDPFLDPPLLDFVVGLSPLPWLFQKHLLRLAMADDLPEAILRRPKTALGVIHKSLLEQPSALWVDAWQPLPEVARYVDWAKIPRLIGPGVDASSSYVNLRPLLLDQWLRTLQQTLAKP